MQFTPRQFRDCLGLFTTGVAVAACAGAGGRRIGITVNSFSSVSLDPPLILWCLDRASSTLSDFVGAETFSVSVLSESQRALAERFADPARHGADIDAFEPGSAGPPVLRDAMARFQCRQHAVHEGGDHLILVGRVLALEMADARPLLYFRGGYRGIGTL
ncbi:MAG: flavin reductase family protein [Alphaproteobacteria bacterium]|nr:flavin reductase family protein [Alphaproteobacteria bacterium]